LEDGKASDSGRIGCEGVNLRRKKYQNSAIPFFEAVGDGQLNVSPNKQAAAFVLFREDKNQLD